MSALGNYVHFTWSGYTTAGSYHNEENWKAPRKNKLDPVYDYDENGG